MTKRIVFDIILFFAMALTPFWCSASVALVGIVIFERYFESVLFFLIVDLLFRSNLSSIHATSVAIMMPLSLYALFALFLREWVAQFVRRGTI